MAAVDGKLAIVLLGPQGSGKGTQAEILAQKLKAAHFEMGEQLRVEKQKGGDFGGKVAKIIDAGHYVADWMIERVLTDYLSKNHHYRVVFDGVPRTMTQSDIFDRVLEKWIFPKPLVIHLKLSSETAMARLLKRGREDDTQAIIKNRLRNHHRLTGPLIKHYRQKGQVIEIDGEPPVKQVARTIEVALKNKGIIR